MDKFYSLSENQIKAGNLLNEHIDFVYEASMACSNYCYKPNGGNFENNVECISKN